MFSSTHFRKCPHGSVFDGIADALLLLALMVEWQLVLRQVCKQCAVDIVLPRPGQQQETQLHFLAWLQEVLAWRSILELESVQGALTEAA